MEIYDFKCIFRYISPIEKKMCKQSVLISSSVCIQLLCLAVTLSHFAIWWLQLVLFGRVKLIKLWISVPEKVMWFGVFLHVLTRKIIYARDYAFDILCKAFESLANLPLLVDVCWRLEMNYVKLCHIEEMNWHCAKVGRRMNLRRRNKNGKRSFLSTSAAGEISY